MHWKHLLFLIMAVPVFMAQEQPRPPENMQDQKEAQNEDLLNQPIPEYSSPKSAPLPEGSSILRTFGSLMAVLGVILGLAWLAKKWLPQSLKAGDGTNHFRFIQNFPLGQKKYLSLVEVDGIRLLLGVSDQQINLIKSFEEFPFSESLSEMNDVKTVSELLEETRGKSK